MTSNRKLVAAFVCAAALAGGIYSLRGADQELTGTAAIHFSLDKLNVLGSVLMIGAHPDDENTGVISYLARGRKIRTGYLSLTRGEGGQNLLGNEQGEYLGALRTQESLAARRVDGAALFFTRAIDFGFTKTAAETLSKWGHDRILSDVVWVIRQQQPDVILLCFSGTPADGHGQHQVSAILGREAFDAAADPAKFPEQLKWVKPWQAKRVMQPRYLFPAPASLPAAAGANGSSGGRGASGAVAAAPAPPPEPDAFTLPIGDYDPVIGKSYREIAITSRAQHKSQAMVRTTTFGEQSNGFLLRGGAPATKDLMDGIDTTWNRVPGGARVGDLLARATRDFTDQHPEKTVSALLEARSLVAGIAKSGNLWARWKLDEMDHAIALCAGLRVEAQANNFAYVPGATAEVHVTAINRSPLPITLARVHLSGWGETAPDTKNRPLPNNKEESIDVKLTVPKDRPVSQPFWLRNPPSGDTYDIQDQNLIGRPDILPEVTVSFDLTVDGRPFSITEPLHYRYADPSRDEFIRPIAVQPPVSVSLPARNFVIATGTVRDISVVVRAAAANQTGDLVFEAPAGWKVEPASYVFDLKDPGATQEVKFRVTPPATPGEGNFRVVANIRGGTPDSTPVATPVATQVATSVNVIDYAHIPAQTIFDASGGRMAAVHMTVLAKRVGYVMGSDDKMPEAIRQMGCQVDLLDEKTLNSGDLSVYDAIVTGLRAFAVRADLRAARQRLLEYVNRGGTMVVQYNRIDDRRASPAVAEAIDHMGPYPFTLSQGDTQRVSEEDAPVRVLEPTSMILNSPNAITAADFSGWVQERSLYAADTWDMKYQTPLETHDTGEKESKGALLYTRYGKGAYVYTSFSWFRELPAGVPGAFRLFANLLSAGKAAQ